MTLARVTNIWGERNYFRSTPRVQAYRDLIYRPIQASLLPDEDSNWGLFGRDGSLVLNASYRRGRERALVGQVLHNAAPLPAEAAPTGDHVYCGPIHPHFGHFLTASLARLWHAIPYWRDSGAKLLFHSADPPESWFLTPYIRAIFDALGVTINDCAWFQVPTRLASVVVPHAAFEEQYSVHDVFHRFTAELGEKLFAGSRGDASPIWLSKTQMRGGVGRFVNEPEIQSILKEAGVRIVYPEELLLPDQVALFAGPGVVLGTLGSAFHVNVFLRSNKRIVGLCPSNILNSNYLLLDSRFRDAVYVYPRETVRQIDDQDGFLRQYLLRDPVATARDLLQIAGL